MAKSDPMHRITPFACLCFLSTGCASIVSKSDWPVAIVSSEPGAEFEVKNEHGVAIAHGKTPTTITLTSKDGFFAGADYTVECGGNRTPLHTSLNGWYFGNILFGGLIGMLIVDPATGAMWKLPESVHVTPGTTAVPAAAPKT